MKRLGEDLLENVPEIIRDWEELVQNQPWFLLPKDERLSDLSAVLIGLVEASLCSPDDEEAHRRKVLAAAEHGWSRRTSGLPEHVMFTEYHLLRQAIWYYLDRKHGPSEAVSQAILRIDGALSIVTNASMWGYNRSEIQALGKWEEGISRIIQSSPLLRRETPHE